MSRALPAHANLDHLKNQAKDLLRELRRRNPGSKLADAQHAIAREYGFASWPKLKAHVESLARPADPAGALVAGPARSNDFERYTPKAREALFFSRYEASEVGSPSIEPEHVLLGLIRASQGLRSRIFESAHVSLEYVHSGVASPAVVREKLSWSVHIPFGDETKRIHRYAAEEAERLLHRNIGIVHLLLGILRDEGSLATAVLKEKGMHLHTVRDDIVHLLNEEPI
jgi:hypothetical protein